jgi:GntR family transcriptional regulator
MILKLDHKSAVPFYVQIEQQLRKLILTPEYKKGKMLPNEIDLSKQLGVSRGTLRQAINKLVFEGLLVRKKGVGTMAADVPIATKAHNWLSFSQEMKALGIEVKNYELAITWVKPTEELCSFFNINKDTNILKLERLRGNTERPFVYFVSYFNPRLGMTGDEDFSRPLYEVLEKNYDTIVKLSKEEISTMAAGSILSKKLKIHVGDPVLKRKRFVYSIDHQPVEWNEGYYRSDSFVYTIESERDI